MRSYYVGFYKAETDRFGQLAVSNSLGGSRYLSSNESVEQQEPKPEAQAQRREESVGEIRFDLVHYPNSKVCSQLIFGGSSSQDPIITVTFVLRRLDITN